MTSPCNDHSLLTAVRFFKIILRTCLADAKLKLPKCFTRKYGDGISNPVTFKPPDGTEWKIYWMKHEDNLWFQEGWKEFATYYSLDHGHLLFFEYKGTSHFDVHIFDNSAVEVDYPCPDGKNNIGKNSDDPVEILDEHLPCQKTRVKSTESSPQPCKKMKNDITTDVERIPNGAKLDQHAQTTSTGSQKAKFMKQNLDEDEGQGIFKAECPKLEQSTSTALNKAATFRSEVPSFTVSMKPSSINEYYLEVPLHFAEKYLEKTHAVVTLEVADQRSWPVIYSAPRIIAGWQKFVSENNLNVGDICVFELFQKIQGLVFKVSISRGAEEPSFPISPGGSSSQRSSQLESNFNSKMPTTGALEEASKFTSENPFFMVTLTCSRDYRTRSPNVPMNFVRKYFVKKKKLMMMIQFRKKLWPVKFVFREHRSSAVFSAGWISFAAENKLLGGDVCIFELINREDVAFDLHVFRGHGEVMH